MEKEVYVYIYISNYCSSESQLEEFDNGCSEILVMPFPSLCSLSSSETRPHSPFLNKSNRALMEIAKQVLKASVERQSGLMSLKPTRVY